MNKQDKEEVLQHLKNAEEVLRGKVLHPEDDEDIWIGLKRIEMVFRSGIEPTRFD